MGDRDLPVILLAFANEHGPGGRFLRQLGAEQRQLREILGRAEDRKLCRVEVVPDATLETIVAGFNRHGDRVVGFHFAGHADGTHLVLESDAGTPHAAVAAGLAEFLGGRRGLMFVLLNGCGTRPQVAALHAAGVAAVVATSWSVDDALARAFAAAFHEQFAAGDPLRSAFARAQGRVVADRGGPTRDLDPGDAPAAEPRG